MATLRRPFTRDQRTTIVYGMLVFVLILVMLQLWLLTATMNAWLGGDQSVVWPALGASSTQSSPTMRPARQTVRRMSRWPRIRRSTGS